MCGIVGEFRWARQPDGRAVAGMLGHLRHRGPDVGGLVAHGAMALGHRRLSIIDTSLAGLQPMVDSSGRYWIVLNGEIYNYRELKTELVQHGAAFRTKSDTEVILEAYKFWGRDFIERLNGMFAFALWDAVEQTGLLARDRAGEKPLYYCELTDGLVFASELTALMAHPEISLARSPSGVADYLALSYFPGDACLLSQVRKLPPAHVLVAANSKVREPVSYWDIAPCFRDKIAIGEREAAERLGALIDDSVRLRLVSDVPLGSFLSGGIDSSAVVGSMVSLQGRDQTHTFSMGFQEDTYDELPEARLVAGHLGTDHHEAIAAAPSPDDIMRICAAMDEPIADTSFIPMWHLAQFARRHVTVCLSGDGADEAFGGYETYIADRLHHLATTLPRGLVRVLPPLVELLPVKFSKVSFDYKARQFATGCGYDADRAHYHWREIFGAAERHDLLRPEWRDACRETSATFRRFSDELKDCDYLDRAFYVDLKTWLADDILTKVDRSTMAHSLEARAPYLDHRILAFAASLPAGLKVGWRRKKIVLKNSQQARLPASVLRRKKAGFNAPVSHWLDGRLEQLGRDVTTSTRLAEWVVPSRVENLWTEHRNRVRDNGYRLFTLICLGLWLERNSARPIARSDDDVRRIDAHAPFTHEHMHA
ncbi:MAG: asparagine synthase (glutamine-hydrolyzing) [Hyphomicrobiales bacterium]|nr:asparagine synthase (glutamine-hydrolyzing) [Hyphomicrobiales bacterium]MBV8825554.1 asparagine synthase (glutamine-hydrolyzing) [Hyphomicrobiales bacterium]MBV9430125.1 asparagine synthase (glutamine-hydrolyzing) [Bradyrhizobiaceae bacterium]